MVDFLFGQNVYFMCSLPPPPPPLPLPMPNYIKLYISIGTSYRITHVFGTVLVGLQ